jgi:hypothetical protein
MSRIPLADAGPRKGAGIYAAFSPRGAAISGDTA